MRPPLLKSFSARLSSRRLPLLRFSSFKLSSLRLRLVAGAALAILVALTLSGVFLNFLFERYVERRVEAELSVYVKQLAAVLELTGENSAALQAPLADPRFQRPLSGLYWQVEGGGSVVLSSRSLFEQPLSLPPFDAVPSVDLTTSQGPDGETLLAFSRVVFLQTPSGQERSLRLTAAIDSAEILNAQRAFASELIVAFSLLAVALLLAATVQILVGLNPLRDLQQKVSAIRSGEASRLTGEFPDEVKPLVEEMNAMLSAHEKAVERARDGAADLAHGLKTPLAVLLSESRKLKEEGREASASEISGQVEAMRDRVEHHLATVRMRGSSHGPTGRTALREGLDKLVRAMRVMPRGDTIEWSLEAPQGALAPIDSQDFFEVFGNLLDNARKWAAQTVDITATSNDSGWRIVISDDGPGIPEEAVDTILSRGGRLDERRTGAGLGLAIAVRVLQAYEGKLSVDNRSEGGATLTVFIPHRI